MKRIQEGGGACVYVYEFFNVEWMDNWHARGFMLRSHRRYWATVASLGFDESRSLEGYKFEKIRVMTNDMGREFKRMVIYDKRSITPALFTEKLVQNEDALRRWFMAEHQACDEAEWDEMVTMFVRRVRMVMRREILDASMWTKDVDPVLAVPLLLSRHGQRAPMAFAYDRFVGEPLEYWRKREDLQEALERLPVRRFDDRSGWDISPMTREVDNLQRECRQRTTPLLREVWPLWTSIEANDAFRMDGSADDGNQSDEAGPE